MGRFDKKGELISKEAFQATLQRISTSNSVNKGESREVREARKARAKVDFAYFVETYLGSIAPDPCAPYHIDMANEMMAKPNHIAVAEWFREGAKSVFGNVEFPMWLMINDELTGMVCMCKTNPDACNQLSDIQAQLMENKLFIHDWGDHYNAGDWADGDFTTIKGIRFVALGRDQSARGLRKGRFRPNYATGDDLDDDELVNNLRRVKQLVKKFLSSVGGALAIEKWRIYIANNRIHPQGFLAHIVGDTKPGMPKRKNLIHSKVCAIENGKPAWPKFTLEQLHAKFDLLGPELTRREYFHEYSVEGSIFLDSYIQLKKMPPLKELKIIIGYFDPSFENSPTSDYKAVAIGGLFKRSDGEFEVLSPKNFCRRCELYEVFDFMLRFTKSLPLGVGIIWYVESQFFNRPIREALDYFNRVNGSNLWLIADERKKEHKYTRLVMMQPLFSRKQVYFNLEEANNSDHEEAINQLKGIEPNYAGADDWPDAFEGMLHYLKQHMTTTGEGVRIGKRTGGANAKQW